MNREWKNLVFGILIVLLLCNIFFWSIIYNLNQPQLLEVIFFNVGQGDGIFIETPQNYQILIDGGPSSVVLEKLGQEMSFWDRNIDLLVLTHPEHDHIAGLIEVLKTYEVKNILWTGVLKDTKEFEEWIKLIKDEKADITIAQAGQRIIIPNIFFEILHPFENLAGQDIKNTNNTSIIIRLVFNDNCFLFTGDVSKSIERKVIDKGLNLDCNVLKVGHHGSKSSTSKELMESVIPELAVISLGKDNKYGHPHAQVLDILNDYGIKILRTDEIGDIKIISDGQNIKLY